MNTLSRMSVVSTIHTMPGRLLLTLNAFCAGIPATTRESIV